VGRNGGGELIYGPPLKLSLSLFSVRARKRKRRTELNRTAGLTHTVVGCRLGGEEEHRERERERESGGGAVRRTYA
jgi:hypothetical protein